MALALLVGVAACGHQWWSFQRERALPMIEEWARAQRVTVLSAERRLLDTGPYPVWTAPDLPVYRVVVRTPRGERRAWLQCGELLWGVLSPAVDARWDD